MARYGRWINRLIAVAPVVHVSLERLLTGVAVCPPLFVRQYRWISNDPRVAWKHDVISRNDAPDVVGA